MQQINVRIKNNTAGAAVIELSHRRFDVDAPEVHTFPKLDANELSDPFGVTFDSTNRTDDSADDDRWFVSAAVEGVLGDDLNGIYLSPGSRLHPATRRRLQVIESVGDQEIVIVVGRHTMHITGGYAGQVDAPMRRVGPYTDKVRNIFVLMLENRSFDHIFGLSAITGTDLATHQVRPIDGASAANTNTYTAPAGGDVSSGPYPQNPVSLDQLSISADPGHEFDDVMVQLCGQVVQLGPDQKYPKLTRTGFVDNYAVALAAHGQLVNKDTLKETMSCIDARSPMALKDLARSFLICDKWFSSMPGPTWPNRFFAVAASSAGLDVSPTFGQTIASEFIRGFRFDHGSVFSRLAANGCSSRVYKDHPGSIIPGQFTITVAMSDMKRRQVRPLTTFAQDLQDTYPHQFTFIEPHYGNVLSKTNPYANGTSQHPVDGIAGGDALIAAVYKAIRNSPGWEHSLLIVTYDEHGGLYDHVDPPPATAPGDTSRYNNKHFDFTLLGTRVPTVVASPWIEEGRIDGATYDHSSIVATVLRMFIGDAEHLTDRDQTARDLRWVLTSPKARTDCPGEIGLVKVNERPLRGAPPSPDDPLPQDGNAYGYLHIAAKVDAELSDGSPQAIDEIVARIQALRTYGEAMAYVRDVEERADAADLADDAIDDVVSGLAETADLASMAARLGLDGNGLAGLLADLSAAAIQRSIDAATAGGMTADQRTALLAAVQAAESVVMPFGTDDGDVFVIAPGTSARLTRSGRSPS